MDSIITLVPYVDKIYCVAHLGKLVTYKQQSAHHGRCREININYTRHGLQTLVREHYRDTRAVLLMDSDVVSTNDALLGLLAQFKGNPLAMRTKSFDTGGHICCACCLMLMEDYLSIDYIGRYVDDCQCLKIAELFGVTYAEGVSAYEVKDKSIYTNVFHGSIIDPYKELAHLHHPSPL